MAMIELVDFNSIYNDQISQISSEETVVETSTE